MYSTASLLYSMGIIIYPCKKKRLGRDADNLTQNGLKTYPFNFFPIGGELL